MTAHWYFESEPDVWTEITDRIGRVDWEVSERAEEGQADMSTIVIDDPDGDFDIRGRIYIYCEEDESEADDNRLYGGIVVDQEIGRGGGEWLNPLGRVWTVSLVDMNTNWVRRVMVGADTVRPAETDVERVQWLMTTTETNWATDRTTWISTANPKDMDAATYTGQTVSQIMDDCAQPAGTQGGKNWYTTLLRDENGDPQIRVWYGKDALAVYDSPLFLTNDPAELDEDSLVSGASVVWPISMDTKLRRDPTRVYSGVYLEHDGGAVYRMDQDTIDEFSPWDFVAPSENVKSKTKAIARAEGYLDELDEQDEVIHTTVELPAAKATQIRAGMRVQFRATHLPGYELYQWCRVLTCSVKPVADGSRYQLTLEMVPVAPAPVVGNVYATLMRSRHYPALGFMHCSNDIPPGWWDLATVQGAIEVVEGSAPYQTVRVLDDMTVRAWATVWWSGVGGDMTITVHLNLNGNSIGSATRSHAGGLTYWQGKFEIDVRDIDVVAGDVFTVTSATSGGWTNFAVNDTWLQVGRGTIILNDFGAVFVGP